MKKKSSRKYLLLIFFLLIIALIFFLPKNSKIEPREFVKNMTSQSSEDLFFSYQIFRYPSNVKIIQFDPKDENINIGMVADPWNLDFGIVPNGGTAGRRFLVLSNLQDKDTKVEFNAYGNISSLINISRNNFILHKGEEVKIEIILSTSESTQPGDYTGEIDIIIKRPKYDFISI